jgi:multidrug efflux pump subunit AcrA (membrane-fusion protein)
VSSRSLSRRSRQPRLGRRPIPPRSSTRSGDVLRSPRGGLLSRFLPAALIAAAVAVVLVIAFGQLGGSTSSARTESEVVTASDGVVQSTVTGTGSLEPVTQEDVDFQTSGTLAHVDVKEGAYVHKGELLATLDDTTAELTLKQARATLTEARTTLTSDEKSLDDSSSSDTSDAIGASGDESEEVSYSPGTVSDTAQSQTGTTSATTPTSTTQGGTGVGAGTGTSRTPTTSGTTTITTTETTTAPTETTTAPTETTTAPTETTTAPTETTTAPTETTTATTTAPDSGSTGTGHTGTGSKASSGSANGSSSSTGSSSSDSSSAGSSSSGSSSTVTAATVDADKLQIVEDEETVKEDREALTETRLRAPVSGTITSLDSIVPGDSVSSGSDSSAGSDSSSSSDDSSASSGTGAISAGSSTTTGSSSSTGSSASSTFAEIDSLKHLSMTVSFTEADINEVKVGQAAVVTLDALSNLELAGKVTEVSSLGTTTDDVTSYDATITLDQYDSRVKPGMSASAEVIIKQGHGVTVPSETVTGTSTLATVTEEVDGKKKTKKVIVGIRGSSRDLIVSGLSAGAELVETETLPAEGSSASGTSTSSSSSATSGFAARAAAGGFSGGGFAGGGGPP